MSEPTSFFDKWNTWIRNSVTFKIVSISILILLMLIPTSMIEDLIWGRKYRQQDAIEEISGKWGNEQTITGPILTIPYNTYYKNDEDEIVTVKKFAHFLPQELLINGTVAPHVRYRGIYEAVLYATELNIAGNFKAPDFDTWKIRNEDVLWDEVSVSVGITDMRGINEEITLHWNDDTYSFGPGVPVFDVIGAGVSVAMNFNDTTHQKGRHQFDFDISLNGSQQLNFVPLGAETNVNLTSEWKHPSFNGQFLPDERNIDENGFEASWKVLQLNRNYPQQWIGGAFKPGNSLFGVELMLGVNQYQKNTRTAKYAVMIISLTFFLFFFMEIMNKKRIHPIQYLLVGFALSIFYSLLLAISEHGSFGLAYIVSSIAVILLIAMYVQGVLRSKKLTGFITGSLTLIYSFIFVILQLQD
ncbi:cell envelope integrity protein CreD [Sphingobacteriaceae bacterium AH-315-L07]|nr:cell envelope integrity protein CreD [Sphingobacteriaceae bacterium AH-315-L07]